MFWAIFPVREQKHVFLPGFLIFSAGLLAGIARRVQGPPASRRRRPSHRLNGCPHTKNDKSYSLVREVSLIMSCPVSLAISAWITRKLSLSHTLGLVCRVASDASQDVCRRRALCLLSRRVATTRNLAILVDLCDTLETFPVLPSLSSSSPREAGTQAA